MIKNIRAARGNNLTCRGWEQEAAMRMLMNNLDEEVAEKPEELIVYGGRGKAARNWPSYHQIIHELKNLGNDETLLVQSGQAVGIIKTHIDAPRVLIANSNLVGKWATWQQFDELEKKGLMMFGQMTAGSWIYIGTQGILQGTYETFAQAARTHFKTDGQLLGKVVLTAGLGGMGGAQPLAITMLSGICLAVEVDEKRAQKRLSTKYLDRITHDVDEAIKLCTDARVKKQSLSIGLIGNAALIHKELWQKGFMPDLITDQTSAHDPLYGYVPKEYSLALWEEMKLKDPSTVVKLAQKSMAEQVEVMLKYQEAGVPVFDYGNNLRAEAQNGGCEKAFSYQGFVPLYIRPLFCEGKGPFRFVALSGEVSDIYAADQALLKLFPKNEGLNRWLKLAKEKVQFQGLPARICWLGYGERALAGELFNHMVKKGEIKAPIVIGRDHLDCGSVASPNRETENMKDQSDAVADWPILNALANTACGASWVSFHHGGGVGMGYSLHAGQVCVADGSDLAQRKLLRVLTADPALGVMRHANAGYELAIDVANSLGVKIP